MVTWRRTNLCVRYTLRSCEVTLYGGERERQAECGEKAAVGGEASFRPTLRFAAKSAGFPRGRVLIVENGGEEGGGDGGGEGSGGGDGRGGAAAAAGDAMGTAVTAVDLFHLERTDSPAREGEAAGGEGRGGGSVRGVGDVGEESKESAGDGGGGGGAADRFAVGNGGFCVAIDREAGTLRLEHDEQDKEDLCGDAATVNAPRLDHVFLAPVTGVAAAGYVHGMSDTGTTSPVMCAMCVWVYYRVCVCVCVMCSERMSPNVT